MPQVCRASVAALLPLLLALALPLRGDDPPSMTAGGPAGGPVERPGANYRITVPGPGWTEPTQPINPGADFERVNAANDAFCMVIAEEEPFELSTLHEIVLFHARSASKNLKERPGSPARCSIDGREALCVEFTAEIDGAGMSYQTTCLVEGGIAYQIVCACPTSKSAALAPDFAAFVGSFRILAPRVPRPPPPPEQHESTALNYRVTAPGPGWSVPTGRTNATADFECRRVATYAFCEVVAEQGEMDLATLRAVAVAHAKSESREFRLLSEDADTVGGQPSRRIEFLSRVGENTVRFVAQYVVAKGVAYQLVCWSPEPLAALNRPSFDAFFRQFALLDRPPKPARLPIAPSHYSDALGYRCAAPSGSWRTPTGRLNVDSDFEMECPGTQGYALVIGETIDAAMTLEKYVGEVQAGLQESGTYALQPSGGKTTLDAVEAVSFECTVELEGITYRYGVTCVVVGGRGFQIYSWSLDELFEKNRDDFRKWMASWKWAPKK